jgi:ABC-type antimicrobial peptide transport system permease subunit
VDNADVQEDFLSGRNFLDKDTMQSPPVATVNDAMARHFLNEVSPIGKDFTLAELEERSIARERLVSTLTSACGLLAVAIACLGLYAMSSYSVVRRRSETGIRLALGASPANMRWLVPCETVTLVAVGIAVGSVVTIPSLRFIGALLYGLSSRDPAALVSAVLVPSFVATLAGMGPAWRASRVRSCPCLRID